MSEKLTDEKKKKLQDALLARSGTTVVRVKARG
jgi:hypothetical protein